MSPSRKIDAHLTKFGLYFRNPSAIQLHPYEFYGGSQSVCIYFCLFFRIEKCTACTFWNWLLCVPTCRTGLVADDPASTYSNLLLGYPYKVTVNYFYHLLSHSTAYAISYNSVERIVTTSHIPWNSVAILLFPLFVRWTLPIMMQSWIANANIFKAVVLACINKYHEINRGFPLLYLFLHYI